MRKKDRIKYRRKYGNNNKVVFYRSPRDCNLGNILRERQGNGSIVLYAYPKKGRKKRLVRMMKIIPKKKKRKWLRGNE